MEAAAICPPKLEEAGLEDCALPPEAIKEAFLKAADFLKSRIIRDGDGDGEGDEDGCCVEDPGPSNGEAPDILLGTGELPTKPLCSGVREKGSFPAGDQEPWVADDVVVVGAEGGISTDEVVVLGGEEAAEGSAEGGKKACVGDDARNWKGDKEKKNGGEDGDGSNEEDERPTLTEVLI